MPSRPPLFKPGGAVRRFAAFPAHQVAQGLNRSLGAINALTNRAGKTIETNVDKAQQLKEAAEEIFVAGRDAALERTEEVAAAEGATGTARATRRTRRSIGALNADELPITGYAGMSADRAVQRIRSLDDARDVRAILAYEQSNKARKSVVKAAEAH